MEAYAKWKGVAHVQSPAELCDYCSVQRESINMYINNMETICFNMI